MATDIYNKDLEPHLPSSNDIQELYRKMREAEKALDEKMKPLYTPDEQMANNLRIQADSIYRAGKWRLIDEADEAVRLKEIEKFKIIIPIIEGKLPKAKPQPVPGL
jgi:formyltetrahydrofolate synthetase